jgi:hypothetical protein
MSRPGTEQVGGAAGSPARCRTTAAAPASPDRGTRSRRSAYRWPPLAIRDHGLCPATLGLIATLNAVLVVVSQPIATNVLARVPQISV